MAKFAGRIGFVLSERIRPGVTKEVVSLKGPYYGDVKRSSLTMQSANSVNTEIRTTNTIEIMADDSYLSENMFAIRFVEWAGTYWSVAEVTEQRPRLLLRLGGVYNGAHPQSSEAPGTPDTP